VSAGLPVGGLVLASVWRVLYQETGETEKKETAT
jgi:hypothetical protein